MLQVVTCNEYQREVAVSQNITCKHIDRVFTFNKVCRLCAANLGKDPIGHFTVQHSHSVKRRKKTQKSGYWTNSSMMLGKDLQELSSFLGSN